MYSGPRIEGCAFTVFTKAFSIPYNNTVVFDQISGSGTDGVSSFVVRGVGGLRAAARAYCKVCVCATLGIRRVRPRDALCALTTRQPLRLVRASPHLEAAVPVVSANRPRPVGRRHRRAPLDNHSDYATYDAREDHTPREGFWLDGGEIHPHSYVSSVSFRSRLPFSSFYLATGHQNVAARACTHTRARARSLSPSLGPLDSRVAYLYRI